MNAFKLNEGNKIGNFLLMTEMEEGEICVVEVVGGMMVTEISHIHTKLSFEAFRTKTASFSNEWARLGGEDGVGMAHIDYIQAELKK